MSAECPISPDGTPTGDVLKQRKDLTFEQAEGVEPLLPNQLKLKELSDGLSQVVSKYILRRMHFIVEFPFPDQEYRRRIWQVVFPRESLRSKPHSP
jgi:hypothetical protein